MSQATNYTVENNDGRSFRLDLNDILAAIRSCNSEANDPPNPVKFMLYGNTADNKIKIYNGSSFTDIGDVTEANLGLLLKAGDTMSGPLLLKSSVLADTPAFAFEGDPDTGIYRKSANTIGIATDGTERATIDEDGITIPSQGEIKFADSDSTRSVSLKSPEEVTADVTFELPAQDGENGQMLGTNGSGALSFLTVTGVPVGSVFCMAGSEVPEGGYFECNGDSINRADYPALFEQIGTTYGTPENEDTFYLPDLRGEFVRGWAHGRSDADDGRSIGTFQNYQNESHNHSATVVESNHSHAYTSPTVGTNPNLKNDSYGSAVEWPTNNGATTAGAKTGLAVNIGSRGGNEARPRNIAMMYVIKY